jgi:hypothetical protein
MSTPKEIALAHIMAGGKIERIVRVDVYRDGGSLLARTDKAGTYRRRVDESMWRHAHSDEIFSEAHSAYIDQRCRDYADELEQQANQIRKKVGHPVWHERFEPVVEWRAPDGNSLLKR